MCNLEEIIKECKNNRLLNWGVDLLIQVQDYRIAKQWNVLFDFLEVQDKLYRMDKRDGKIKGIEEDDPFYLEDFSV